MFSLIADIKRVEPSRCMDIELNCEGKSFEDLLIIWLEKLLYCFEVENMVFSRINVKKLGCSGLSAVLYGEKIDNKKHKIMKSIKAPTYHMLSISKNISSIWEGTVIFDV
jgi:SHS2 domain-containing protein